MMVARSSGLPLASSARSNASACPCSAPARIRSFRVITSRRWLRAWASAALSRSALSSTIARASFGSRSLMPLTLVNWAAFSTAATAQSACSRM